MEIVAPAATWEPSEAFSNRLIRFSSSSSVMAGRVFSATKRLDRVDHFAPAPLKVSAALKARAESRLSLHGFSESGDQISACR